MTRVSAIVSTYNSERFFRGCIDDLLAQSLWTQGDLEIVVVVSGSRENEHRIVREYLRSGVDITLIHTPREGIYTAWNRAIRLSTGTYLTNANTDDRHHPEALRMLADALDADPEAAVAYADSWVTDTVNATWETFNISTKVPYTNGQLRHPDDPLPVLPSQYCLGSQPMWRRTLHARIGLFDESYLLAGDYDFFLRAAAAGTRFIHVPHLLGLFYYADNSTTVNQSLSDQEARRALLKWRPSLAQIHT